MKTKMVFHFGFLGMAMLACSQETSLGVDRGTGETMGADGDVDTDTDVDADAHADADADGDGNGDRDTDADTDTDSDTDTDVDTDSDGDPTFESCGQWASWSVNGYTLYNNIWGSGAGTQCLWANNQSYWGIWADHPNTGGIKAYPNVDYDVNYTVSSMPNITVSFNSTSPNWGSYNNAFDIWYNNYAYEIMLWVSWRGEMGPISYNYGCGGYPSSACPVATDVNVGGHTWNLYEGTNGFATVYSFLRTSNTNSGTVNITQISQWLANNGYFSSNTNLHEIQFGWEISQSSGGADFVMNSYNIDIGGRE